MSLDKRKNQRDFYYTQHKINLLDKAVSFPHNIPAKSLIDVARLPQDRRRHEIDRNRV